MTTQVRGQDVPVGIVFGLCHQVVREYDAGEVRGYKYPRGTNSQGLPWFADFRKAVEFLENKPFAGHIQSYVMKEDGSGPSWVTSGMYYRKDGGRKDGPVSAVDCDLSGQDEGWQAIKHLAGWVIGVGERQQQARFELGKLDRQDQSQWPVSFRSAVAEADLWCCSSILVHYTAGELIVDRWGNDQWAVFAKGASADEYVFGPFDTYDQAVEALQAAV